MNPNVGTMTSTVRGFPMMNPIEFYGFKVKEDPQQFIVVSYKVLGIIGVTLVEIVELSIY